MFVYLVNFVSTSKFFSSAVTSKRKNLQAHKFPFTSTYTYIHTIFFVLTLNPINQSEVNFRLWLFLNAEPRIVYRYGIWSTIHCDYMDIMPIDVAREHCRSYRLKKNIPMNQFGDTLQTHCLTQTSSVCFQKGLDKYSHKMLKTIPLSAERGVLEDERVNCADFLLNAC